MQNTIIDFQGVEYTELQNLNSLRVVKDQAEVIYLLVQNRGLLIPAKSNEMNFHIVHGKVFLYGVAFNAGRNEKKGDSVNIKRASITAVYNKVTLIFFTDEAQKAVTEIMCPQFG